MKLLAIDGNSLVNRAFFGLRMLNAPDGTPTNAVYGFLSILQRLLEQERPDGVAVAFDLHEPTFRRLRYDGYKAQRKGMPEDLQIQIPILKEVLDAMGIFRMELAGYEADDLLGTLSRRCEQCGDECVIVTGDRDAFQLITEHTHVLHVKTRQGQTETLDYTLERFREEYGFEPGLIIDLKALMGDASDNIPGVAGVGEKTASALVRRYGGIDAIYAGLDTPDMKDSVRKKLVAGADMARLSYELATIVTDVPVEVTPEQTRWNGHYGDALYPLFLRLGFTKFIEKFHVSPPAEQTTEPESAQPTVEIVLLPDLSAVDAAAAALRAADSVCYWCLPELDFAAVMPEGGVCYVLERDSFAPASDYTAALRALFAPDIRKVGHNVKNLQRALLELDVPPEGWIFDTALAAYLLDATAGSYELPRLCVRYCGYEPWHAPEERDGQLSLLADETQTAAETRAHRAALAAAVAALYPTLKRQLAEDGMERLYYEVELPLCPVLSDMEREGFLVDRAALAEFGESMTDSIDALQQSIWGYAGTSFNINSPKQLGEVLFETLMLPAGKKNQRGWSTSADVLEKLRDKHPIVNQILDYRMLTKLKSTYADGLLKVISPDGRIRTSFQMTVTATGRLSSTEPNLQNIPIRREFGGQIRKMFVAPEGRVLVDADYSQIELRLLAHISGDENLRAAVAGGEDIHAVTASQVFGIPLSQVTKLQRSHAKAVNFGIVYGISAWSLAQDIDVSVAEAKAYMAAYLEKYSGVRDYQKRIVAQARADGYVSTLFGRRRALPELKSSNYAQRSFGERVALNMPIQGTAADLIKLAMVRVFHRLRAEGLRGRLILQVHDELIVECPEDEAEQVQDILVEEMESMRDAAELSVPLTVDAHIGHSWAEAH